MAGRHCVRRCRRKFFPAGLQTERRAVWGRFLWSDNFDAARSTSRQAVVFRVVDIAGLPFTGSATPKIAISSGDGTVSKPYRTGSVPGTYAVDIRTGASSMQLDITVGNVTHSVIIPVV